VVTKVGLTVSDLNVGPNKYIIHMYLNIYQYQT